LLGKLIGVEADELEYLYFLDGRADLTPPELEKAAKLAEALALRPELTLEITGVVDTEVDSLALRTAKLDLIVAERVAALTSSSGDNDMYAEQRKTVLEQLLTEQQISSDPALALQDLRARFTIQIESSDGGASNMQFDELAYTNDLRRQLIELQALTETDLVTLAVARKKNARLAILMNNETLQNQVVLGANIDVHKGANEMIRMKVTLSASGATKADDEAAESEELL
jgi:hypothetical protein